MRHAMTLKCPPPSTCATTPPTPPNAANDTTTAIATTTTTTIHNMPRLKRLRPKRSTQPTFLLSLVVFLLSAVVFVHYCVTPLRPSHWRHAFISFTSKTSFKSSSLHSLRHDANNGNSESAHRYAHPQPVTDHHQNQQQQNASIFTSSPISADTNAANAVADALSNIPSGPFPLPPLSNAASPSSPIAATTIANSNNNSTINKNNTNTNVQSGSSWTASLARRLLPSLPLHWLSESLHSASVSLSPTMSVTSIFRARRKGDWIGCTRPHHLVCKGVYRALKATNAVTVAVTNCHAQRDWLPHILRKLRDELRPIRLTCLELPRGGEGRGRGDDENADADGDHGTTAAAKRARTMTRREINETYTAVGLSEVRVIELDAEKRVADSDAADTEHNEEDGNAGDAGVGTEMGQVDMVVVYRAVESGTLIEAMRLFQWVKTTRVARLLTVETYPDNENSAGRPVSGKMRVNVGVAPFWFPAPVFEYANEEENVEGVDMEIVSVRVHEMFEESGTPEMKDLVDPRKRVVQE